MEIQVLEVIFMQIYAVFAFLHKILIYFKICDSNLYVQQNKTSLKFGSNIVSLNYSFLGLDIRNMRILTKPCNK